MWFDVLPPTNWRESLCRDIPPSSLTSGFKLTRKRRSSSMSESSLSSTVSLTSAELVALFSTSKKACIVSGRHLNSTKKFCVSSSLISLVSCHVTAAASISFPSSKRNGSPHICSPLHAVLSWILEARHACAYFAMLRSGNAAWSHMAPSTVCSPRGPSSGKHFAAALKAVVPSGENNASWSPVDACESRRTSFDQQCRSNLCRRPACTSEVNFTRNAPAMGPCRAIAGGGLRRGFIGWRTFMKRSSISLRASFLPMKTILHMRSSPSFHSGPSDVSVTSATAWKMSRVFLPAAARIPLLRYRTPISSGMVEIMRIHLAKASGSTSTPFRMMLKLPIPLSCVSAKPCPWPWPAPPP
mmetsp:Transcript_84514/g.167787  ORF Transcript_84514/g.167787 Transcript_84514/m.167787 type:complete len:356 (-) Transcript_84514:512-1579(-)